MASTTTNGTTTSFTNTPQARDDNYNFTEDDLLLPSGIYDDVFKILSLDVMSNDLGGAAKTLYSVADGAGNPINDSFQLLAKDVQPDGISAWERTSNHNWIRINNGKVDFALAGAKDTNGPSGISINSLSATDVVNDSFVLSIRLGNGTLSQANVTLKITGNNDGATITANPGSDYSVEEAGGVANGTPGDPIASGKLTVVDVDAGESAFAAANSFANYGTYTLGTDGAWTYNLDNTNSFVQALGEGKTLTDSFVAVSKDGTASQTVTITITGTNDVPVINGETTGDRAVKEESDLSASGTLEIIDADTGESAFAAANSFANYGTYTLGTDGAWTYNLDNTNSSVQALGEGKTLTDSFVAVSKDGTASQTVTITITGTNDVPVINGETTGDRAVKEESDLSASGTLEIIDADTGESAFAAANSFANYGTYTLGTDGAWTYNLDNTNSFVQALGEGKTLTDSFVAVSKDGTASQTVTITITGTNDVPVINGETTGDRAVKEESDLSASGTLEIIDADTGESAFAAANSFANYGTYTLGTDGAWTYNLDNTNSSVQALGEGKTLTDSFVAVSKDGTASQTVTITITGTNDVPVINGETTGDRAVKEESDLSASGTLEIIDADTGESAFAAANSFANYGTYTLGTDGAWTYNLDNTNSFVQALGEGKTLTDSFVAVSKDGTASQTVTITITGTNDVPVINGETTGDRAVKEESDLSASGTLSITDPDAGQSEFTTSAGATAYGSYSLGSNGVWNYALNNANATVQALGEGETLTDSFVAVSKDSTVSETVTITITGTADGAVAAPPPPVYNGADPNDNNLAGDGAAATLVLPVNNMLNGDNIIRGTNGNDVINSGGGADVIYGYGGDDTLDGDGDTDSIYGGTGNDTINGGQGVDTIYGGSGNDLIVGNSQNDVIYGGSGNDTIIGDAHDDTIIGGFGADTLTGSSGSDIFKYLDTRDTGDTITDFGTGDKIDFSAIDANLNTAGDGSFSFAGNTTTLSANSVIWFVSNNGTPGNAADDYRVVQVDTDGNIATAEMEIHLTGVTPLVSADFIL